MNVGVDDRMPIYQQVVEALQVSEENRHALWLWGIDLYYYPNGKVYAYIPVNDGKLWLPGEGDYVVKDKRGRIRGLTCQEFEAVFELKPDAAERG